LASEIKRHFDANLRGRAHKIKGDSTRALYSLQNSHAMSDLIYIDGDHSAHQVMVDSILAWRLGPGGIMISDECQEGRETIELFRQKHNPELLANAAQEMVVGRR
jgi:predicted O-methyltransferase YrrM